MHASGDSGNGEVVHTQIEGSRTFADPESIALAPEHPIPRISALSSPKRITESELEYHARQATAIARIRGRLEETGTKTKIYFPVGSVAIGLGSFGEELWKCEYNYGAGPCPWTGRFSELVIHYATSHHTFQEAGPEARWTVCLNCLTPAPGWGTSSGCKACSNPSWRSWYWGFVAKIDTSPIMTVGPSEGQASSLQLLKQTPLMDTGPRKEKIKASYSDALEGKTHNASANPRGRHSLYTTEDANSRAETWTSSSARLSSTIEPSSANDSTTGTKRSYTTASTSFSSGINPSGIRKDDGKQALGSIPEREVQMSMEAQRHGTSTIEPPASVDNISVISQGSTEYSPHQKDDVVFRFTQAMLLHLPENLNYFAIGETSRQ
ncbi:hypothetical protein F4678DRAFT_462438 [Xylaria arbuscula]|nr:hypothetical protein F4678DRAFT_462438 [Xylaria arbuscula]